MKKLSTYFICLFLSSSYMGLAQQLRIQPLRTLPFTVNEGSYMNLSVSSDGKTLVFDLLGDLYTLPVKGGQAIQLTKGIALHIQPCWMPDGKHIGYKGDGSGDMKFRIIDLVSKTDRLADTAESSVLDAIISASNEVRSPDGRWLAKTVDTGGTKALLVVDQRNGSERLFVTSLLQKPYSYRPPVNRFCFSPDSKSIYISYGGKIHCIQVETGEDKIIPFTAKVQSDMGHLVYNRFPIEQSSFSVRYTRSANRSPDGKTVVFSALGKIYLKELPNGSPLRFNNQELNQFQPVFSPDGKQVAYVSWSDAEAGQVWIADKDGRQLRQLTTEPGNYQHPAWSPDGKYIAVVKGDPKLTDRDDKGEAQLQLVAVKDGRVKVLEEKVPLWNQLNFLDNGKHLAYQPIFQNLGNGDGAVIASIDTTGMERKIMLKGKIDNQNLKQRTISANGRYIAFSWCEDIYLAPLKKDTILSEAVNLNAISWTKLGPGVDPYWEQDGQTLSWSYGNKMYAVDPASALHGSQPKVIADLSFKVQTYHGQGNIALKNARIITMKGNEVIQQGTMLIKGGRIAVIGAATTVKLPPGIKVIDLQGATIMPGMVDLHLHMRFSPDIFPQQSWMCRANLAYGVTTANDPSSSYDSFGYAEMLKAGVLSGPRLFTVGRAARMGDGFAQMNSLEDALELTHKRQQMGGTVVKQYLLDTRFKRQWQLQACKRGGLNMTNEGAYDPFDQIGMLKDGSTRIEHNPAWGDVYEDVIQLYARSGTWLTPALQVTHGTEHAKEYFKYKYWKHADDKMRRFILSNPSQDGSTLNGAESLETILSATPKDTIEKAFLAPARINARIYHAGGRIALGSHGNDEGIGAHNELWALQMGGLTNMEALRVATLSGAEALGMQNDIGSLEKGKIADLIILNSNPLDDIHNSRDIRYVMKDGVLYDGDTLDELWPNKKKAPAIAR